MSDQYDDPVDWMVLTESYILGIPNIDEQHKHLISLCNKFRAALVKYDSGESPEWHTAMLEALRETAQYAITHFASEEKLMEATNYDEYEYHKFCHKSFIETVQDNEFSFHAATLDSAYEFVDYLKEWILSHISYEDKRFADHVKAFLKQKKM